MNEVQIEALSTKPEWWMANENKYGRFFKNGFRSFNIYINVNRNHLKACGAIIKNGMGTFVNDPLMHRELEKKILGKAANVE